MSAQTEAVAAEVARCGSLDNAIAQLAHDACGAEWGSPVLVIFRAALAERAAREEAANPALKARRLRTKASDLRAAYDGFMADYGAEIGLATRRTAQGEDVLAALAESAANASLLLAGDALAQALALEDEADKLSEWTVLFDGVSVRAQPALTMAAE